MCREKPQRGSLKKLQAHRKQRSTHCENILYQGAGEQRRRCWLDGSGGQRENDTSRHNIYKYFVKYCPGVVSLWDVGLRDNPARCAVLINKFQYFDFWSLLLFLNTQDNLKSNNLVTPRRDRRQGCKPKGPLRANSLRANSGTERIWVQHTVPNKKGKQKPVKSKFCNWTF